jgi:hypothetical protein
VKEKSGHFKNIQFVEMNVSKLVNYSNGHVLKWPRYYNIHGLESIVKNPNGNCATIIYFYY